MRSLMRARVSARPQTRAEALAARRSTRPRARGGISARAGRSWSEEFRDDDASSEVNTNAKDAATDAPERSFAYEPKSKSKKRRDRSTTRRASVAVDSPAVDAARGTAPKTMSQESEEAFVKFLLGYITVIFLCGVVLGVSAFGALPEAADGFVETKLYPFFTPFVGGFLAFSSVYGLIKTRDDPGSK